MSRYSLWYQSDDAARGGPDVVPERLHNLRAGRCRAHLVRTPAMKCHPGACPRLLILIVPASPATPFESVAVLGVVVVIRIALNFSLDVEIDAHGRGAPASSRRSSRSRGFGHRVGPETPAERSYPALALASPTDTVLRVPTAAAKPGTARHLGTTRLT